VAVVAGGVDRVLRVEPGDSGSLCDHVVIGDIEAAAEAQAGDRERERGTAAVATGPNRRPGCATTIHRVTLRLDQRQREQARVALGKREALIREAEALIAGTQAARFRKWSNYGDPFDVPEGPFNTLRGEVRDWTVQRIEKRRWP